jgi:aspartate/methionine/tyrosine aminotransferase
MNTERKTPSRPYGDRNQGRKALPENERAKSRSIRMTEEHFDKYRALGGTEWLREAIDQAYERLQHKN